MKLHKLMELDELDELVLLVFHRQIEAFHGRG